MTPLPTDTDLLVAHPVPLLAAGLAAALGPGARLAGPVSAAQLLDGGAPAVLVSDLPLALAVLAQNRPQPGRPLQVWRCVVVSADAGCGPVRHALQQGVLGFVQAGCHLDELQRAVAAARAGQHFLCSGSAASLAEAAVDEPLTRRETEVLQLLCLGLDNKSIALRLSMALGTVKTHVKAILEKLGASSRTQAVAAAHRRGLAPPAGLLPGATAWATGVIATPRPAAAPRVQCTGAPARGATAGGQALARS